MVFPKRRKWFGFIRIIRRNDSNLVDMTYLNSRIYLCPGENEVVIKEQVGSELKQLQKELEKNRDN